MNKKITPYIYTVFLSLLCLNIYGQKKNSYKLKISSSSKVENFHISTLKFNKEFGSKKNLIKTKDSIISILKEKGFYTLVEDSLVINNKHYTSFINLGKKTTIASLKIDPDDTQLLKTLGLNVKNNLISLKIKDLKNTLTQINTKLVNIGQSFSKVKLKNITISGSILTADLSINHSKKRTIDKIIIKGYSNFPKSFLKHYFNLHSNKIANPKFITEISRKTNQLDFIKEKKKPEILFSKDSTILYLYINKTKTNYFDGLVNFNSENKKIKLRGYFDLNLKNAFNKGEEININWRNNGNSKQDFTLKSKIPYTFNTKSSTTFSFNIYKHDSTYTNTRTNLAIHYPISNNLSTYFIVENETSQINNNSTNIKDFKKLGIGLGFKYNSFKKEKLNLNIELHHKIRETEKTTSLYQINIFSAATLKISKRINLYIKNTSKLTSKRTSLNNELFRSGGVNSIRGFQENSILSNSYTFINSELRLLNINNNTSFYSIHDIGLFDINKHNKTLTSLGIGYRFLRGNSKYNLEYIISNPTRDNTVKSSMISIKVLTLF